MVSCRIYLNVKRDDGYHTVDTMQHMEFDEYEPEFPILVVNGRRFVHNEDDARTTYHPLLDGCAVCFTETEETNLDFRL